MFNKVRELREERENGFTLIELLVVILIIGILSAIAIPAFLNQRKAAVDASVESDVNNAAKSIENWMVKNPAAVVPNQTITSSSGGSNASGDGSNSGTLAFIAVNIPSTVISALAADDAKVSDGTTVLVKGTANPGEYCLYGVNSGGDKSNKDAGVVRDSTGSACAYDGTPESIPVDVAALIAGASTGSDAGAAEGHEDIAITRTGTMSDVTDGPFNEDYTLVYSMNESTRLVTFDITFSVNDSGYGDMVFGGPSHGTYVNFTAVDGKAHGTFTVDPENTFFQFSGGNFHSNLGDNYYMYE